MARSALQYTILACALSLASYIVAFHGFDAVVKNVMLQMQAEAGTDLRGARAVPLIVAPPL